MSELYNLSEFKKAQLEVKDLAKIVKVLTVARAGLVNYVKYRAVFEILTTIDTYLPLLKIALEERKIVVETKGRRK